MPPPRLTTPSRSGSQSPLGGHAGVRFGANYVPSRGWFYSWLDHSHDDTRRDFEDLAGLGLDHVRIFPVWPWLQPNRTFIRPRAVEDVLSTIDIAAEFGLDVAVDLLQGHLSSFDFLPSWVLTWHRRSLFTDPHIRQGIRSLVETVGSAAATRKNVIALTLGNETNNLWPSNPVTAAESRVWAAELLDTARKAAPHLLCQYSLFDDALYDPQHPFEPADMVDLGDLTTVHSWVFNGVARLDGPVGPATVSHADYMIELAAAIAEDDDRPVWLQEIGAPAPEISAADIDPFVTQTLGHALENPLLWGVTWWCSHDLDRGLSDFPEREYDLGLFTVDHRRKPVAQAVATVIAETRGRRRAFTPRPALVCPVDLRTEPQRRAEVAPGSEFHRLWVKHRQLGPVAIIRPSAGREPADLSSRGISEVLHA